VIQFKRIHVHNFLTIGDAEVQFEQGMFLVKGENLDNELTRSNGAGKSNLFAAVSYCLFGHTPNGKEADSVINWVAGNNCSVVLEFELSGNQYRVERYRKHKKNKNNLFVFINGEDRSEHTAKASQLLVNSIIGIEPSMFNSIIILAQGLENRFSQLKETARRDLIQGIRNNLIWDKARELAKRDLSEVTAKLQNVATQIFSANTIIATKKQLIRDLMTRIERLNENLISISVDSGLGALNSTMTSMTKEEEELNDLLDRNSKSIIEIENQIDEYNNNLIPIREQYSEKKTRYEIANSRVNNPTTRCNSCGTILSQATDDELSQLKSEVTKLFNEVTNLKQQGETINVKIVELKQKKSNLQQGSSDASIRIRQIQQKSKQIIDEINTIGNQERSICNEISYNTSQAQLEQQEISVLCDQIISKTEEQTILQETQLRLQQIDKIFSPKGIPAFLLNQDIEFLNSRLIVYSEYLFSSEIISLDSGLNESGEVSKLNIQMLNNTNGRITDYTDRSGGERRRMDLAIQLSLRDLVMSVSSVNTNLLVLDEVFEGIDSEGLVHVLEMLRNTVGNTYCTYVITHINDLAYDYFNGEVSLIRQNDITTILKN
jgi:DNA repair exonuclease SbcCD ATPase subunit